MAVLRGSCKKQYQKYITNLNTQFLLFSETDSTQLQTSTFNFLLSWPASNLLGYL